MQERIQNMKKGLLMLIAAAAFTTAGTVECFNKGTSRIERKNAASDGTGNPWPAESFWQIF